MNLKKKKEVHTLKSFFHVLKSLVSIGEELFNFAFSASVFSYHPRENYVCCLKYSFEWLAILFLLSPYSFHVKKSKRSEQAALHAKKSRPESGGALKRDNMEYPRFFRFWPKESEKEKMKKTLPAARKDRYPTFWKTTRLHVRPAPPGKDLIVRGRFRD